MRQHLATTLALFFARAWADGTIASHKQQVGSHLGAPDHGIGVGSLFQGQVVQPLTQHLDGKSPGLGQVQGTDPSTVPLLADSGECYHGIVKPYFENQTNCACQERQWGCDPETHMSIGTPNLANLQSVSNQVIVTSVPAQVLLTNTTTQTTGQFLHDSCGHRQKQENQLFSATGNFTVSQFDC